MNDVVYKCELCGTHVAQTLAHMHQADGKWLAFCSADHRVEWLELNEALAQERDRAEVRRGGDQG
jgi:hypothetical protein